MTNSFPSKERPVECIKGCGTKIYLSKKGNRYLPYDSIDDTIHNCMKKQETNSNLPQDKQQDRKTRIANVIETIRSIIPELEALK